VQHYPSHIADDFEEKAAHHADHETPCFVLDTKTELRYEEDAEDGCVNGIPRQCWEEMNFSTLQWAGVDCAEIIVKRACSVEGHFE
jgi:hypothetical protein